MPDEPSLPPEQPSEPPGDDATDAGKKYLERMFGEFEDRFTNAAGGIMKRQFAEYDSRLEALMTRISAFAQAIPQADVVAQKAAALIMQQVPAATESPKTASPTVVVNAGGGQPPQTPQTGLAAFNPNDPKGMIMGLIGQFLSPAGLMQLKQFFTGQNPSNFDPKVLTMGQMDSLFTARQDEMAFLAQKHMPDAIMDIWPSESTKIYHQAWTAGVAAQRSALRGNGWKDTDIPEPEGAASPVTSIPTARPRRRSSDSTGESSSGTADAPPSNATQPAVPPLVFSPTSSQRAPVRAEKLRALLSSNNNA